jgi:hypothetical protein
MRFRNQTSTTSSKNCANYVQRLQYTESLLNGSSNESGQRDPVDTSRTKSDKISEGRVASDRQGAR